jgi:hypothetical protein
MSNNLGNPTLKSSKARENEILSYNSTLTSAPTIANPLLRIRNGSTTLVDLVLDPTTPFTGGAVDGAATFNFAAPTAVAVGGTQTLPDNYQVIGRDNAVHLSGPMLSATEAITTGQTVTAGSITATEPAS